MAPQQTGVGEVTNQSDIWSLGLVIYELPTGRNPFGANSLPGIIHLTTTRSYIPIHELRANAAQQYKTCLDVAGDLSLVFDQLNLSEKELSERETFKHIKGLTFFRDFTVSETREVINANIWRG